MRRKLPLKFALTYLIFAVLSFTCIATLTSHFAYQNCLKQSARELREESRSLAESLGLIYDGVIEETSDSFFRELNEIGDLQNISIWIMNPENEIVFDSNAMLEGRQIEAFDVTDTTAYYRVGTFYDNFSKDQLSVYSPITANYRTYGYVLLHKSTTSIRQMSDSLLIPTYITFAVILLLSLSFLVVFLFEVERPLTKIIQAAGKYADGDLKYRLKVRSRNELGYLANTLDYMAQELEKTEEYQRRFISNVSHDFRSPLTSIKGYLEAIKDGIIPMEEQDKYLDIIIGEAERLTGLTQNMLQLNALDEVGMQLNYSDFDITRVIKDTCNLFEGICSSREIRFELIFSDACVMVHADRSRIQQVIYNLVDNAIKFSPNQSEIIIEVFERYEKVFISVKDHGQGIPKDRINKIWTRFYKSDESRGKDKKGTGLGLSIVKEIINAHKENIDVISTEGIGSEFIFRLKRSERESE